MKLKIRFASDIAKGIQMSFASSLVPLSSASLADLLPQLRRSVETIRIEICGGIKLS